MSRRWRSAGDADPATTGLGHAESISPRGAHGARAAQPGEGDPVETVSAERLVEVVVEIADTLVDDFDLMAFLYLLTRRTAELLDASEVGLMVSGGSGELQFVAASREVAQTLELFQLQVREGPCLDAYTSGTAVSNAVLARSLDRWPEFAPRAIRE